MWLPFEPTSARRLRVLVGCEESGQVRAAFRGLGHNAYSCDLSPARDGSPYHIRADLLSVLRDGWDLLIAHPPCTYLCNSGVSRLVHVPPNPSPGVLYGPARWDAMRAAAGFFTALLAAPIERIALENPIMHGHAGIRRPDQTIQPYFFGDDASKRTGLWLRGLAPLVIPAEDQWFPPRIVNGRPRWGNQTDSGQNKLPPNVNRARDRSVTYPGIARAMAWQWAGDARDSAA
jgi:hypothetical protein